MIQANTVGILLVIAAMAIVTLCTRLGSLPLMARLPFGPRTQLFIKYMASSVLVAILAPIALEGDLAARAALITTAVVMLITKRALVAIGFGIFVTALVRNFLL